MFTRTWVWKSPRTRSPYHLLYQQATSCTISQLNFNLERFALSPKISPLRPQLEENTSKSSAGFRAQRSFLDPLKFVHSNQWTSALIGVLSASLLLCWRFDLSPWSLSSKFHAIAAHLLLHFIRDTPLHIFVLESRRFSRVMIHKFLVRRSFVSRMTVFGHFQVCSTSNSRYWAVRVIFYRFNWLLLDM